MRKLFAENPELAKTTDKHASPLFALPENEDHAFEVAELLLANGVDPPVVSEDGTTAAEHAQKQGLDAVAGLLTTPIGPRHA